MIQSGFYLTASPLVQRGFYTPMAHRHGHRLSFYSVVAKICAVVGENLLSHKEF